MAVHRLWQWTSAFGRFWYGFIIGDDWAAAAGVLVMLGAGYGLLRAHVPAWWAGPVVITFTLLVTLWRAGQRQRAAQPQHDQQTNSDAANEDGTMEITEQILADHHEQRRMFALLDELGDNPAWLTPVWERLTVLLEVHADAEERLFYPRLLTVGAGSGGADSAQDETKDAIRDHDDIRDGIRRARQHPVGSSDWWRAVRDTRIANSDHMAEEEREALADFRRHAGWQARRDLGIEFAVYEAAHAGGVPLTDRDPDTYLRDHAR
jgi:Hemerythrin HHE cation binding domain